MSPRTPKPINLGFDTKIRADGNLTRVTITQVDQRIALTKEQAESLGEVLRHKFPRTKSTKPKSTKPMEVNS